MLLATVTAVTGWLASTASSQAGHQVNAALLATAPSAAPAAATSITTSTLAPLVAFDHDLGRGSTGRSVQLLQDRLRELHFDPGPSDGQFGPATTRAVWAFEKLVMGVPRGAVTGVVTSAMWQAMSQPIEIRPRRPSTDTHLEVYLPEQVAVLFVNAAVRLVTHISSGDGQEWCSKVTIDNDDGSHIIKGICGTSITPGGVYRFQDKVEGWKNAALGRLYNPVFFNYGIAVHGASNVPDHPASHGCIRIPMHIAEYFSTLVGIGDLVYVFDGVEQPETYGAQLPVFDRADPNSTTTTSTDAPTTTTSTLTPTTTIVATPPRSTTVSPPTTTHHSEPASSTSVDATATSTVASQPDPIPGTSMTAGPTSVT